MAVLIKPAGVTAVWGVVTAEGDTFAAAKVQSMSVKHGAEQEPLPDKQGETTGLAIYDAKDELTVEVIVETATPEPALGDALKVDAVEGIVLGSEKKWENKGWKKLAITGTKFHAFPAAT